MRTNCVLNLSLKITPYIVSIPDSQLLGVIGMKKVQLDQSKLLGLKILPSVSKTKIDGKIGGKIGESKVSSKRSVSRLETNDQNKAQS